MKLNDAVTEGQCVAVQRNGFGDAVQEHIAPGDGRVAISGGDAASERGSEFPALLANRPDCGTKACNYVGDPKEWSRIGFTRPSRESPAAPSRSSGLRRP